MRLGEEEQAKEVLDEAFKVDPFNVRVNNTLKVLEVLDGYETLETEHFRIKFDPATTRSWPDTWANGWKKSIRSLVRQMGFAPPEKSLFEVFSKAKNTDGHGWFSARMVGLPHIHPIGACAGKIVALQSPSEGEQRFNWARVLKHEFIHVINLQQTRFQHSALVHRGGGRLERGLSAAASLERRAVGACRGQDKLFNLDTINLGFIRPHSSDDWTLAYCQAELYAEYMLATVRRRRDRENAGGLCRQPDHARGLGRGRSACRQADFEQRLSAYVAKIVAELPTAAKQREMTLVEVQKGLAKNPHDAGCCWPSWRRLSWGGKTIPKRGAGRRGAGHRAAHGAGPLRAGPAALAGGRKSGGASTARRGLGSRQSAREPAGPAGRLEVESRGLSRRPRSLYELGARATRHSAKWLKSLGGRVSEVGDKTTSWPRC